MQPRELLAKLIERDGTNPTALSRITGTKQPQIHRYLQGLVREPKRSTMEPLAKHFSIPVDALLDTLAATKTAAELGLLDKPAHHVSEPLRTYQVGVSTPLLVRQLAERIEAMAPQDQAALGALLDTLAKSGGSKKYQELVISLLSFPAK